MMKKVWQLQKSFKKVQYIKINGILNKNGIIEKGKYSGKSIQEAEQLVLQK